MFSPTLLLLTSKLLKKKYFGKFGKGVDQAEKIFRRRKAFALICPDNFLLDVLDSVVTSLFQ